MSKSPKNQKCNYCGGFGYVQVYRTIVLRVYCDCEAGDNRIKEMKETLREAGLDPDSSDYRWPRRSEYGWNV